MTLHELKTLAENSHINYGDKRLAEPILELFRKEQFYFDRCIELEKERNAWKDYAKALEKEHGLDKI